MNDNDKSKAERARALYIEQGPPLDPIATVLGVTVEWLRGVLFRETTQQSERPAPPPPPTERIRTPAEEDMAAAAELNRQLQDGGGARRPVMGEFDIPAPPPGVTRRRVGE